MTIDCRKQPEA